MSEILFNKRLSEDFFLLSARSVNSARPGQFYMLRAWRSYPVLSRPISVFDSDGESIAFLYRVAGEGTKIFSGLKAGEDITLHGPYGNGFPEASGRIALIGGGAGIAPLYFAAKTFKARGKAADIFLGFSEEALLAKEFEAEAGRLIVDVGGYITDMVDTREYECIMACGPEPMLRALYQRRGTQGSEAEVYVSLENRMACGFGACLVCTCSTGGGNKRVCRDGPVFSAEEVFGA